MRGIGLRLLLGSSAAAALGLGISGVARAQQAMVEGGAINLDSIVVSAPLGLSRSDIVEGTTVLDGDALERRRALTLGETLSGTPGVSSTGYAAGASRPVIRGQTGPRVRVLQNGLDTFDASNVSPDHAVAAPVAGAERIEVLRGPATLLYGSSAVGGLVNVIDGRIPERMPKGGISGSGRLEYGTGAREIGGFGAVDTALGRNLALHVEGFAQNAGDYSIPGYANEEARERGQRGKVENSFVRNRGGSAGASYIGDWGYAGISVSRFASKYGIPSGGHAHAEGEDHEHDHEQEEEADEQVTIDLRQTRYDAKFAILSPLAGIEELRGRIGYADYRHTELESGVPGTVFKNRSWEGRLEAAHAPLGGIKGVVGVQAGSRDFRAIGEEAFIPPTVTDNYAAFVLERYEAGPWLFTAGGRLEYQRVEAAALGQERTFTGGNVALGATYRLGGGWSLGASLSRTERAPSAEELYSNGAHLATNSFEIGDPGLGKEKAWNAEVSLRKRQGDVTGGVNLFASRYNDFIFGDFTGTTSDGLEVLRYRQTDADFRGVELEAAWTFARGAGYVLSVDGQADFVWAENRSAGTPLPRIPPVSYTVGANADLGQLGFRAELQGALRQDRTSPNETETGGYTFLNVSMSWRPLPDNDAFTLQVQGRNLTNAEGRNHVSLLKDVAPMRGREVRLVGQVQF